MEQSVLEIKDFTFKYKKKVIFDHFDLKIPEKCIYSLVGESHTGKTTLQRVLAGQLPYKKGDIMIYGRQDNFSHHNRLGTNVLRLDENVSVIGNLVNECRLWRLKHAKNEAMAIITLMHLEDIAGLKVRRLADSKRQLLKMAMAITGYSPLVCLDEPFAALSDDDIRLVKNVITMLHEERNMSFLITSHTLMALEDFSDVIGIIKDGQLACEMNRQVLKEKLTKEIRVRVNDPQAAAALLDNAKIDGNWLILDHGDSAAINSKLLDQGLHVYEIKIVRENFTHFFNTYLGGEK